MVLADAPLKLTLAELTKESAAAARSATLPAYGDALVEAVKGELDGKAPKVVSKFAGTDAGAFAIAQWRLLSRVKPE